MGVDVVPVVGVVAVSDVVELLLPGVEAANALSKQKYM